MKKSNFLLIIFIIFLIITSGCSKKTDVLSCKLGLDCPDKKCMDKTCEKKRCSYAPIPNCCGNSIKEDIENGIPGNKCNCPEDYGNCSGSIDKYTEYMCTDDFRCIVDVKKSLLTAVTKINDIDLDEISLSTNSVFNQPFNLKKDTFNVEISVNSMKDYVSEFKIKNIQLLMKEKKSLISLGEKQLGKYLWGVGDKIKENLILDFVTDKTSDELKNLILKIDYEYQKISKITDKKLLVADSASVGYGTTEFIYVNPPINYLCPSDCDDGNPATRDYCSEETKFFCYHKFIPNTCGNYVCEENENKCTCTIDCGRCEGNYKQYMKWQCVNNQCLRVSKKEPEKVSILDERTIQGYYLVFKYNYFIPFDVANSTFDIEIKYKKMEKPLDYLDITSMYLLEKDVILGSTDNRISIETYPNSSSIINIPMSFALEAGGEEVKDIILKINYEYSGTEGAGESLYKKKFDDFYFFNPDYR